jgi:hypothetical protein
LRDDQILDHFDLADLFRFSQVNQQLYLGLRTKTKRTEKLWGEAVDRTDTMNHFAASQLVGTGLNVVGLAYSLYSPFCQVRPSSPFLRFILPFLTLTHPSHPLSSAMTPALVRG